MTACLGGCSWHRPQLCPGGTTCVCHRCCGHRRPHAGAAQQIHPHDGSAGPTDRGPKRSRHSRIPPNPHIGHFDQHLPAAGHSGQPGNGLNPKDRTLTGFVEVRLQAVICGLNMAASPAGWLPQSCTLRLCRSLKASDSMRCVWGCIAKRLTFTFMLSWCGVTKTSSLPTAHRVSWSF